MQQIIRKPLRQPRLLVVSVIDAKNIVDTWLIKPEEDSEEDPEPEEETDTGNVVNEPELTTTTVFVQRETSPGKTLLISRCSLRSSRLRWEMLESILVTINYGEDPQVVVKKEGVKETVTVEIDGIKYVMVTEEKDGSGTKVRRFLCNSDSVSECKWWIS